MLNARVGLGRRHTGSHADRLRDCGDILGERHLNAPSPAVALKGLLAKRPLASLDHHEPHGRIGTPVWVAVVMALVSSGSRFCSAVGNLPVLR